MKTESAENICAILEEMKTSRIANYVIPGLDSYLLNGGLVRLFECSREHQHFVTPHSHRFNFAALVITGYVINTLWTECAEDEGDFFESSRLVYQGDVGKHIKRPDGRGWYKSEPCAFEAGDSYFMNHQDIHSIEFSRGAKVLFFEGAPMSDSSVIIEPVVDGSVIKTYKNEPWMFRHELPGKR